MCQGKVAFFFLDVLSSECFDISTENIESLAVMLAEDYRGIFRHCWKVNNGGRSFDLLSFLRIIYFSADATPKYVTQDENQLVKDYIRLCVNVDTKLVEVSSLEKRYGDGSVTNN